jgi:phenylalanyl-tRNA synthetase beta chain
VLDLKLDLLVAMASDERHYQPLPRYPAVTRDLALIVDRAVTAARLDAIIREPAPRSLSRSAVRRL